MSQGGQTNRRTPQYNDPYQAVNSTNLTNATSPGRPFGSGNSISDPFVRQAQDIAAAAPGPIYTDQANGYQNPILSGVSHQSPTNSIYAGATGMGTMANSNNPYTVTQANAMNYTNTQNYLFPQNQIDGQRNGTGISPDLNSFDAVSQPINQNYANSQPSTTAQPYPNGYNYSTSQFSQTQTNATGFNQAPVNINNDGYNQMYMQAPTFPQTGNVNPSNATPYKNTNPYIDTSTAEGSMDYLNAIAPAKTQTTGLTSIKPSKLFPIAGGAMLVLVILVAIIAALGGGGKNTATDKAAALQESINNLAVMVAYGSNNKVFSDDLTNVIAETDIVLTSDQSALADAGLIDSGDGSDSSNGSSNNDTSNITGNKKSSTQDDQQDPTQVFQAKMEKARNNGSLDKSFKSSLQDGMADTINNAESTYNATKDDNAKKTLSNLYKNLTELKKHVDAASISIDQAS